MNQNGLHPGNRGVPPLGKQRDQQKEEATGTPTGHLQKVRCRQELKDSFNFLPKRRI
jgi:hypothetical protein